MMFSYAEPSLGTILQPQYVNNSLFIIDDTLPEFSPSITWKIIDRIVFYF